MRTTPQVVPSQKARDDPLTSASLTSELVNREIAHSFKRVTLSQLMATGSPSSVAFGALGTLVGYVGAEVASDAIFSRLLWPKRFYNTHHPTDFIALAALMPMGGPIHKAALATLDQLITSGLNTGYCRGDMLGTAFYEDIKQKYLLRRGEQYEADPQKEVRNGLWVRAMGLVHWRALEKTLIPRYTENSHKDEEAAKRVTRLRARRPVFWLTLQYGDKCGGIQQNQKPRQTTNAVQERTTTKPMQGLLVEEKSEFFQIHVLLGIVVSEIISLGVGIFIAIFWRSPFAVWFFSPLLIKLMGLAFSVRRQALEPVGPKPTELGHMPVKSPHTIISEISDISRGFFLIEGPSDLVMQFYKHYGHPERYRRGLNGDRLREVVCLALVVICILIFPTGLIAFVFAPQPIQWIWLGYQLYTTVAMHFFRFVDGGTIGSTESELARALRKDKCVRFRDPQGKIIYAQLDLKIVDSIADGRVAIDQKLKSVNNQ